MRTIKRGIRATAWAAVALGAVMPVLRNHPRTRGRIDTRSAFAVTSVAPFVLCMLVPRTRKRDFLTCLLQMWAYIIFHELPNEDPQKLERRVRIDYPITLDRLIGLGKLPALRLQHALARNGPTRFDKALIWVYWLWFLVPHTAMLYILTRHYERFGRAATIMYATFNLGSVAYWILPTAPPWYAAEQRQLNGSDERPLRRLMIEYGCEFWGERWDPMYEFLGGNPLAAMPSLHFATSLQAAYLLRECGPVQGVIGYAYLSALGVGIIYLGEHYVVDLLAGLALARVIYRHGDRAAPLLSGVASAVGVLERRAAV